LRIRAPAEKLSLIVKVENGGQMQGQSQSRPSGRLVNETQSGLLQF
jgi:hypothetical protein